MKEVGLVNKSFEQTDFDEAIESKDYIRLKTYIINSICSNPGFVRMAPGEKSEASIAFSKLLEMKDQLPGLFSEYELQAGEQEFDESNEDIWDQEYFLRQVFFLGENFCTKRYDQVHKIGSYIARKELNFEEPQEVIEKNKHKSDPEYESADINISVMEKPLIMIMVIVTVIALLVGFITKIKWIMYISSCLAVVTIVVTILNINKRS